MVSFNSSYFKSLTDRVRYWVNNALKEVGTRKHGANLVPGKLEGQWVIGRKFLLGTFLEIVAHESELLENNSFVCDLPFAIVGKCRDDGTIRQTTTTGTPLHTPS